MKKILLKTLSQAINKILSWDPESFDKLKALDQKRIRLEMTEPTLTLYLEFNDQGVRVFEALEELSDDIIIQGASVDLFKLSQQAHVNLYESQVKITGDMALADGLRKIFSQIEIDWEGGLAEYVGDVPARVVGQGMRAGGRILKRVASHLAQDLKEYTQEEIRVLPTRLETTHFTDTVRDLRNTVDHLSARVNKLSR